MAREGWFGGFDCLLVMGIEAALFALLDAPVGHSALTRHIQFSAKEIKEESSVEGTKKIEDRSQETYLWCGFRKWDTSMCNLPLNCYISIPSWLYRCAKHLKLEDQSIFMFHSLTWWVLQGRNVPEPFTDWHCSTGCFGTCHNFRYKSWNGGKLPFGKEFASYGEVLAEKWKIGFIKKIQDFSYGETFLLLKVWFSKTETFHEKVLVSVNLSGNALENSDFYNIRCFPCNSEDSDSVIWNRI